MIKFPDIDPVIVSFGPFAVSWYSLSYVFGILIGWYYCLKLIKLSDSKITSQNIDDFASWLIIGVIVGGRLGHVLFYDPTKYLSNPIDILKTYEGGMSFHGGILGVVISTYYFCRSRKINFFTMSDILACAAPIGLFLGRLANFINAELYGRVTDVPWAVVFPYSDMLPRHPSQIYEALLEGVATFTILAYLVFFHRALDKRGLASGTFLLLYSFSRIFVEFFREVDFKTGYILGYITMGQFLCIPMLFFGLFLMKQSVSRCR